jgi:hypothetical protein
MARRSFQEEESTEGDDAPLAETRVVSGDAVDEAEFGGEHVSGGPFFSPDPSGAWQNRLHVDPRKPPIPKAATNYEGQDEIRWGDAQVFEVLVPAAGGSPFAVPLQILQATRPARKWAAYFSVEFLNATEITQQATELVIGAFAITAQIGSSRTVFDAAPQIALPALPNVLNPVVTKTAFLDFPAKQILVQGTLQVVGVAFATDRIFRARLACGVAPITR